MGVDDLSERLSAARHETENDEATVHAVVDGSGQVIEIRLDPKAARLDSERLSQVITETLRSAQAAAREALPEAVGAGGAATPDTESLTRLAGELGAGAQQRLAEISGTLDRLLARDAGPAGTAGRGN
jgi:DNA-binding protein YbaB